MLRTIGIQAPLLAAIASSSWAEDFGGFYDAILGTGVARDPRGHGVGLTTGTDAVFVFFDGGVEYTNWQRHRDAHGDKHVDAGLRGYFGLGAMTMLQIQGGFGSDGGSLRLRSDLPLDFLFDREGTHFPGFPSEKRRDPVFPVITPWVEFVSGGDVRFGISLGIGIG